MCVRDIEREEQLTLGSEDVQDAFNCGSLSAKEPLITGHFEEINL